MGCSFNILTCWLTNHSDRIAGSSNQSANSPAISSVARKKFCPIYQKGVGCPLAFWISCLAACLPFNDFGSFSSRKHWFLIIQNASGSRPDSRISLVAACMSWGLKVCEREYRNAPKQQKHMNELKRKWRIKTCYIISYNTISYIILYNIIS